MMRVVSGKLTLTIRIIKSNQLFETLTPFFTERASVNVHSGKLLTKTVNVNR